DCRAFEEFTQTALFRLAPTRMIDVRVHVGIEPVLVGRSQVPGCWWLLLDKRDLHDGFNALESELPRHHEANRRSVLVLQRLAVHPDAENHQRVHRLVQAQPLEVRERNPGVTGNRHLLRIVKALECYKFGLHGWLHLPDQGTEWKANPGNDDGPALHTAVPVNAFL